jgi:hypothetical protein
MQPNIQFSWVIMFWQKLAWTSLIFFKFPLFHIFVETLSSHFLRCLRFYSVNERMVHSQSTLQCELWGEIWMNTRYHFTVPNNYNVLYFFISCFVLFIYLIIPGDWRKTFEAVSCISKIMFKNNFYPIWTNDTSNKIVRKILQHYLIRYFVVFVTKIILFFFIYFF